MYNAASQRVASYGCTALKGTNKKGVLKPDDTGYYTLVVGALDVFNSGGAFYPLGPAKALFDESAAFIRRVNDGCLKGEVGHPDPTGLSMQQFMTRVMKIDDRNVCCHFRRVYLDDTVLRDERGRKVMAIMAEVKPTGPFAATLQAALDNPYENVCFSIRSITNDRMSNGTLYKSIKTIVTFDLVIEPGIKYAKRWFAPGLESFSLQEHQILPAHLEAAARMQDELAVLGMESAGGVSARAVIEDLGWHQSIAQAAPPANRW